MHAHRATMSKDKEVTMAHAFAAKMGDDAGAVMDLVTELDMDHYENS